MRNHCPHCDNSSSTLVSVAYNNGSAQWSFYRCEHCNTEWKVTRWLEVIVTKKGATPQEVSKEAMRFAVLWNVHTELCRSNAPEDWHRGVKYALRND